jgi:acetyltransferase-like isoleucine patch superfamily enzyme
MRSTFITHIDMIKSRLGIIYPATSSPIIVQDHVYIGSNTQVLMGCKIGEGTLIAAGSLVVESICRNSLAGGVPCKILKKIPS